MATLVTKEDGKAVTEPLFLGRYHVVETKAPYGMDEEHFKNFMNSVHLRQLYDTGVDAEYGDHLITLSTCEYTYTNGRFVVVAKKV